ncbi:MAG: 8-oxoguanine deaminase, partial [Actinobacteria bacterium]|nr:8-oxoguanine deaminase [Actinomycetota bacterium]
MTAIDREAEPFDLVIHNAALIATVDDDRTEVRDGWVAVRDGLIADIGSGQAPTALERIDATGCLVTPGLINTH